MCMHLFLRIPNKGESSTSLKMCLFFLKIRCIQKCFVVFNSQDRRPTLHPQPPCFSSVSGNQPVFPLQEVNGSE